MTVIVENKFARFNTHDVVLRDWNGDAVADRSGYAYDDEDDNVGGEVFGATVASNNPFAATADVDVDYLTPAAGTAEFNPFATITDDEQEVFDPFQTIHDDDALNVPFSSEDRDTEEDATSPSRSEFPSTFSG